MRGWATRLSNTVVRAGVGGLGVWVLLGVVFAKIVAMAISSPETGLVGPTQPDYKVIKRPNAAR